MSEPKKFSSYKDFQNHCKNVTGIIPFSGVGIFYKAKTNTCILRSVDDTYYYYDNLTRSCMVKYTFFGLNGDQDLYESRYNRHLLKSKNIYLYRVSNVNEGNKIWTWYGKYEVTGICKKIHQGKDHNMRTIYIAKMRKID